MSSSSSSSVCRPPTASAASAVRRAAMETLEARQMLSVTLENGLLMITGTAGDDSISVSRDLKRRGALIVNVNGFRNSADDRAVSRILINALAGDDLVRVDESAGAIRVRVAIDGGKGNDTLSGGSANDAVQGGVGDDVIRGGGGRDALVGGAGNDKMFGGLGRDTLRGDSGADALYTGGERDRVSTGGNKGDQLDTTVPMYHPGTVAKKPAAQPAILDNTFDVFVDGYSADQTRKAYGLGAIGDASFTNRGQGQTVAIVIAYHSPTLRDDLAVYSARFGLPAPTKENLQVYYTTKQRPAVDPGWAGEEALDVQSVHAIAPEAKIIVVEAVNNGGPALLQAVQKAGQLLQADGGGVISMSYGSNEFFALNDEEVYASLPSNVSLVASTGDSGAEVNFPAGSAFVTAVGGTTLPLDANGNRTGAETGWIGSGGGLSFYHGRPDYQAGLTVPSVLWGDRRGVPDVSFNADPATGFGIYNTTPAFLNADTGWDGVGGTSHSAPAFAGFVALVNQQRAENGRGTIGNALNSAIYRAARRDYAANFIDIQTGNNGYPAGTGYDLVTGLGSPRGTAFISSLANDVISPTSNLKFEEARLVLDPEVTGRPVQEMLFGGSGFIGNNGGDLVLDLVPNASSGVSLLLSDPLVSNGNGFYTGTGQVQVQLDSEHSVSYLTKFVARTERRNRRDVVIGEFYAVSKRGKIIYFNDKPIFYGTFGG